MKFSVRHRAPNESLKAVYVSSYMSFPSVTVIEKLLK